MTASPTVAGRLIYGRVLDVDGNPVQGADVYAIVDTGNVYTFSPDSQQPTGSDGAYLIHLDNDAIRWPAQVIVKVSIAGSAQIPLDVQVADAPVEFDLKLPRWTPVSGVVRTSTGHPCSNAAVEAQDFSAPGLSNNEVSDAFGTSDSSGNFTLLLVPDNWYIYAQSSENDGVLVKVGHSAVSNVKVPAGAGCG